MTNVVLAPARGFPPVWLEDDSVYMYTRAVDHLFVRILYCTDEVLHTYFVLHTQQHYVEGLCLNHQNLRLLRRSSPSLPARPCPLHRTHQHYQCL
jgi:hypothetical protein